MPLLKTYAVPHPPLIIPTIGQGREKEIQQTIDAYKQVAESIANDQPDLIIFITPHGKVYEDYIHISPGASATGDFSRYNAPGEQFQVAYDELFIKHLNILAEHMDIPAGTLGGRGAEALDHGVMIPMHFINAQYTDYKAVRISMSMLPIETHYRFGQCIKEAINGIERRVVIIASGDLSHKLTEDGPYGFAPEGPAFDEQLCAAFKEGDFLEMMYFDPAFCNKASECGLRSFIIMAGALDGYDVIPTFLSYEGPFGVGYAVCAFEPDEENDERCFLPRYQAHYEWLINNRRKKEDDYVRLARISLETFVKTNNIVTQYPGNLPEEMTKTRAGVFVSIKKDGRLRGCIGTTEPHFDNIMEEIIGNAISSGTRDPRFDAVTEDELPHLVYSVDVLSPAEPVTGLEDLDAERYGIIVTSGSKRGLLLPNLEGVENPKQQIAIACQKADISETEKFEIQRFEVVRHL